MSTLIEELSAKARTLSAEDRARLAEDLLASQEQSPESSTAAEAAWEQEIRRRVEEVNAGTAKLDVVKHRADHVDRRGARSVEYSSV